MRRLSLVCSMLIIWVGLIWSNSAAQQQPVETPWVTEIEATAPSTAKSPVITAVAILPGGSLVATAGDDHLIRLWSTETGRMVRALRGHADWVRCLVFSPDAHLLASAADDRQIIMWDVSAGKAIRRLAAHPHVIYSLSFSPDGQAIAAAGFERKIRIYNPATGDQLHELEGPCADLRSVVFSPDGKQLAAAGRNGQIRVWSMPSGTERLEITTGLGRIRTLAYLPDGDKLVSAGESRTIALWNAENGQAAYHFSCPTGKVLSMAVCGESLVATGGTDNAVRIWNWQTQREVNRLDGHTGSVAALAYEQLSGTLISGSFDTTIRVWRLRQTAPAKDTAKGSPTNARIR